MNSLALQQSIIEGVNSRAAEIIAKAFTMVINERFYERPLGCMCPYCAAHHEYTSFSILAKRERRNWDAHWFAENTFANMAAMARQRREEIAERLGISSEHMLQAKKSDRKVSLTN